MADRWFDLPVWAHRPFFLLADEHKGTSNVTAMAVIVRLIGLLIGLKLTAGATKLNPVPDPPAQPGNIFYTVHRRHRGAPALQEAPMSTKPKIDAEKQAYVALSETASEFLHSRRSDNLDAPDHPKAGNPDKKKGSNDSADQKHSKIRTVMKIAAILIVVIILLYCGGCCFCYCAFVRNNSSNLEIGWNSCIMGSFLIVVVSIVIIGDAIAQKRVPWWILLAGAVAFAYCCFTPRFFSNTRIYSSSGSLDAPEQPDPPEHQPSPEMHPEIQQLLRRIWVTFFNSCLERGMLEVRDGRLSKEWIEEVDPRLMLALPSIVILQCILDSKSSDGVVLPDGTEVSSSTKGSLPIPAEVSDRLLDAKTEFLKIGTLTDDEREYLELHALQVTEPTPLPNMERQAQINRAASTISAAATSVTQLSLYSNMDYVLTEMGERLRRQNSEQVAHESSLES